MVNRDYEFRGGLWIGFSGSTWPFGVLDVNTERLVIHDELLQKEYKFSKNEIVRIEIAFVKQSAESDAA